MRPPHEITPAAAPRSRQWRGTGLRGVATSSGAGLVLASVAEVCAIGLVGLSGWFLASCAVAGGLAVSSFSYLPPSGGVQAFALGRIVSTYANRVVLHAAALRRITTARLRFYDRAAATIDPGTWSGESLDQVLADAGTGGMALIQATAPRVVAATLTSSACAIVLLIGYPVTALVLAIATAACAWLAARSARRADDGSATRSALRTELVTATEAWPEMASLGAADQLASRTLRRLAHFEGRQHGQTTRQAHTTGLARAVTAATLLLTIASAAHHGARAATLVFLALLAVGVMTSVERLIPAAQAEKLARQANERLGAPSSGPVSPRPTLQATYEHGDLTVSGYRLPDTPTRDGRLLMFRVAAGGTLLITGASGSGKTTLLTALEAALRTQPRAVVTAVRANDHTFTGTVADNIWLANPAVNEAEISDLLTSMRLDTPTDTPVGVGGRDLSGGETRRLHIARALATRPDVLIIDEPTTGLDHTTANHVLAEIRRLLPHTVLILAIHKPPPELLANTAATLSLD